MEIKQTEKDYASQLETCIEVFLEPLEKALAENPDTAPMNKEQIDAIFMNIRDIFEFHKTFAKEIEERFGNEQWTASKCLGDIFLKLTTITSAYSEFAQKYPQSIDTFNSLQTNKKCQAFLLSCKEKSRLDLPSLLITPIQRIPRYNLLLLEYNKHTWASHRDKPMLQKAIATVKTMAETINTTKSQVESERRLKQLYDSVKGIPESVMKPGRVVVTEASFSVKYHSPVALVLFKDALLWYRPGTSRKAPKYKGCFDLWCLELSQKAGDELSFEILRSGKSLLKLVTKDPSTSIGFVRIWNDTKKTYEDSRAKARQQENDVVMRKRRNSALPTVSCASNVLVSRNKGAQKNGKFYGKLTDAERQEAIDGLHVQRIAVQQQLLSLEKTKIKQSERESLKASLNEQIDEINARLAELGVSGAHAPTIQLTTRAPPSPSPGTNIRNPTSGSRSPSPSSSPDEGNEEPEKRGHGFHLFRRDHNRRLSDSSLALERNHSMNDSDTSSPDFSSPPNSARPAVGDTSSGEHFKTPCAPAAKTQRPGGRTTMLVVNSGSVQDRIRQINSASSNASTNPTGTPTTGRRSPSPARRIPSPSPSNK